MIFVSIVMSRHRVGAKRRRMTGSSAASSTPWRLNL
jgi:hypothetical protein